MRRWKLALEKFKSSKTYLLILGASATLWFLIRVLPKPSRATYPCMRAAAPIMSSFLIYLLGISVSLISFKRFRYFFRTSRYMAGSIFLLLSILSFGFIFLHDQKDAVARALNPVDSTFPINSNEPIGEAKGLFPGRVVWVQDEDATDENYKTDGSTGYWYNNTDEGVVMAMLERSLIEYAGTEDIASAWDAIFRAFNANHGRGDIGYVPGEKIAFKINLTNQNIWGDGNRYKQMDATPQVLNAALQQLINVVGVAPGDITMGDPYREFRQEYRNLVKSSYPGVVYVDGSGENGINQTKPSTESVMVFSNGQHTSTLPQQYLDATYVINIPCLKTHDEGGITLIAKNHQGSYLKKGDSPKGQSAMLMHPYLSKNSRGSGKYRHIVDYMGHEQTGGKALIYIIDGIWAGQSWQGYIQKYVTAPFNNDYPNSLFVGQDPVALESVCYDIMFHEYDNDPAKEKYPITFKVEIADYLKQCASSDHWPDGIQYDPEDDGTPMGSLGVLEHWNNATDREYSRNLGTGDGIELIHVMNDESVGFNKPIIQNSSLAAPNPFTHSTSFHLPGQVSDQASLEIYNLKGQMVRELDFSSSPLVVWDGSDASRNPLPDGMYLYTIQDPVNNSWLSGKVILKRY